ncbi:AAA domain-containing protein [Domibacillus sp. A3M-37]|uniref:DEAD/DEAH box helicase n=1 Tax=Domibacillus sp. A3M-37 TaxID=2962037 RepID=UPI0020B8D319|nr:AAA domain-containing protein [Domibacillus sp. A3M-37]MCP3761424.1 AAA domain-containing protein [Domibacillus sp. A3M-37]
MINTGTNTYRCPITLTNKAKEKMRELGLDERSFFSLEESFKIYIEKYPQAADRLLSAALFFDNEANRRMAEQCKDQVIVLHCVVEKNRLIATNMTARVAHTAVQTNWRRPVFLAFDQKAMSVPAGLVGLIHEMPVAQESSAYVKKRIASWEGYLTIQERDADIPDMTASYSRLTFNGDFSRVTLTGCQLNEKEWKSLKDLSVKIKGIDQDIGKVLKANRGARTVEVELNSHMAERARRQRFDSAQKEVVFSNFATLSQVKRLRQGFKHLENGLAANPDLERILFEKKPPIQPPKKLAPLSFHNRLNEFQKKAVTGAMAAEDLYVIQGPPGTGKTTVISEICLQNARAGLRTLVASQSNLAVDNALGRLLANKDIRILRVGRTESIEEEGKKFIEENVGQYWKDHTLKEVSAQFEARKKREAELEAEWTANERAYDQTGPLLQQAEAAVEAKKNAEKKQSEIQSFIDEQQKSMQGAEREHQSLQQQVQEIEQTLRLVDKAIEKDSLFLREEPNSETLQKEQAAIQLTIQNLKNSVACDDLQDHINRKKEDNNQKTLEYEQLSETLKNANGTVEKVTAVKRIDGLKWIMLEQNIERSSRIMYLMNEMDDIRAEMDQFSKLKAYNDQLSRAISYVEQMLTPHRAPIEELKKRAAGMPASYTSDDIDQFLNELREAIKRTRNHDLRQMASYLGGLYSRKYFVWQRAKRLKSYDTYKSIAREIFQSLKQEITEQLWQKQHVNETSHQQLRRSLEEQQAELHSLQNKHKQMKASGDYIPNAKETLRQSEVNMLELQKKQEQYEQVTQRVETNRNEQLKRTAQLKEVEQKLSQVETNLAELQNTIRQKEIELAPLHEILSTQPEREHEELLKQMASLSFTRESLKQEKQKLPLFQKVQGEWLSLLNEASDHDLDEIRKLYVKHANVIGTTCVASARKDFIDNYPVFDVVIIDEVSKATPPELLLPMLKGKKVILVGDHHQLPPLLGNDTLEETLQEMAEENGEFEGKAELKGLLQESLFERLFKNVPESNRMMLAIQYRMHKGIMETITPFYEQENERLQCGLTDSDSDRDHLLESPLIERNNHLLWLNMPNEPAFFEERMKGGKSLFNTAELQEIGALLKELDRAAAEAKQAGRMKTDELKSVGVISFYGEQVKRIDRMIQQELRLNHLTIRTGTVDRFQGMEMDVILLSMVRNHQNKQDDIGFAKDYRRLNVALSRARELLVLVGSTEMFTERTKQAGTRKMYTHVLEAVKGQNGLRMLEGVNAHG